MNPISLSCPICQDKHGLLNWDDIDIWLWLQAIVPVHNPKGAFDHALWPIFQQPGRWNTLVGGMSYASVTPDMLQESMTACWTWPEGSIVADPEALAAWLGMYVGVTPMQAHFTLEPYTHHRAQGCYYSPIVQDMYNQLQVHQHPLLPTTGGMPAAPSFAPAIGLAVRLSYPLGTTIQPPAASASSATDYSPNIHWPLSHSHALPPHLVGGHTSRAARYCPCPHGGGWHCCGHAPW